MFPLFNLPIVAIRRFIQSICAWEVYKLSLISTKMRNLIISIGVRKKLLCCMVLHKSVKFLFDYPQNLEYEDESDEVRKRKIQEMQELFDFEHQLEVEGSGFCDIDKDAFEWRYKGLFVRLNTGQFSEENARFLFTNPNIESLHIWSFGSPPTTPYTGPVLIPHIYLYHREQLSLDAFFNMEAIEFSGGSSSMTPEDINRFLKTWKEGVKLKDLESCHLVLKAGFHLTDIERMIGGIEAKKEQKDRLISYHLKRDGRICRLIYFHDEMVLITI